MKDLDSKFDVVYKLQNEVFDIFRDEAKLGHVDFRKQSRFSKKLEEFKKEFDSLKEDILKSDSKNYSHLNYGNIHSAKPFIINEKETGIERTKDFKGIFRDFFGS